MDKNVPGPITRARTSAVFPDKVSGGSIRHTASAGTVRIRSCRGSRDGST
jgi:hypothetical protein